MQERTDCGGAARRRALRVGALLAFGAAGFRAAASDCALLPSHFDADGRARRAAVSRATRAFATSHPSVTGSAFHPVLHIRHVNYVDDEIFGKMEADKVASAPLSSDTEFLRRVTLDLTGRIPDADVVAGFVADSSGDKRSRMVDTLLASDAFVDRWTFYYEELLQNTRASSAGSLWNQNMNAYHAYIQDAVRSHKPWDVMAREMIGATGVTTTNAAANYVLRQQQENGPAQDTFDNLASATAATFLGLNAPLCTSCHNGQGHLDAINLWGSTVKRQDFWGMAAFFSRVAITRTGTYDTSFSTIAEKVTGQYNLNTTTGNKTARTSAYYTTTPPGLGDIAPAYLRTPLNPAGGAPLAGESNRSALGRLVTSDPQFARATVNYLWKEMFKLGIVEPADGFDPLRQDPASPPPGQWTIQPTHPTLLAKLAQDFAAHGYDLRWILGVMAKSNAYQLSSSYPGTWSETYTPYFARHFAQRLMAEEVWDAIVKATGVRSNMAVDWAMQLTGTEAQNGPTLNGRLMGPFGPGNRDTVPRLNKFSIMQALTLMNNNQVTIRAKPAIAGTAANKLVTANATAPQIVTSLYLQTLSRYPTPAETSLCLSLFTARYSGSTAVFANDLQWALLNKLDFVYNY